MNVARLLCSLLAAITDAQADPLELTASEGARAAVLPRTDPRVIEIGIYGNRAPLREDVFAWRTKGLDHANIVNRGGGTEFLVLTLSRPELEASLRQVGSTIWLSLEQGQPELHPIRELYTSEQLFGELARRPQPWPDVPLVPLLREGRTYGLDPTEIRLPIGEGPRTPPGWESSLAAVAEPGWEEVARWRNLLDELHDTPELLVTANWRLGEAHRALGLPREAMYYFKQGTTRGFPPAAMFIGLADSALAAGQWETARDACEQARYRGAPEETVLACLGVLSLATSHPPPAETGRALGQSTRSPLYQLLAGELLLRDGHTEEGGALLAEAATRSFNNRIKELAWVARGDAAMIEGDLEMAQRAYLSAPKESLQSVLEVRKLALRMADDGVNRWPYWVPDLRRIASGRDAAAADALYLLAQVHARYADSEAIASDLARLWDLDPISRRTDVPERLIGACRARITQLQEEGRDAELVQQFEVCWREGVSEHLDAVDFIEAASRAWERLGSPERALTIEHHATGVLAAIGREDAMVLARLAHLQTATGHPDLALETITYAGRLKGADRVQASLDLVSGDAYEAQGLMKEALVAWNRAATTHLQTAPWLAEEVQLRTGMLYLRLERCAEGVALMRERLEREAVPGEPPGEIELLLARCEAKLGLPQQAIGHAALALSRADDEWLITEIKWFASAIAATQGTSLPEDLRSDATGFGSVAAEDEAHARFTERLSAWRQRAER